MSPHSHPLSARGIRGYLERLRFKFLKRNLPQAENTYSLFELGCFDGTSLYFIPHPSRYVGADSGWKGGIEDARMTYNKTQWVELITVQSPHDLRQYKHQSFDYSVALETLQYMPDALLREYLFFLAQITAKQLIVTVPVEIGPMLLLKYLANKMGFNPHSDEIHEYSLAELKAGIRGESEKIRRFERKGFDYRALLKAMNEHFDIVQVEGLPFKKSPRFSVQVGIIATPKRKK